MKRRSFLKKAALGVAAGSVAAPALEPPVKVRPVTVSVAAMVPAISARLDIRPFPF